MGGEPWFYFVPYQPDINRALQGLRKREFEADYGAITAVSEEQLVELFGTKTPTRDMIESNEDLFETIDRGQGVYIVAYRDGKPSEIFFAGYSFD